MQNKLLITFIIFFFSTVMPTYALQLDLSVDEEIKKKYNSSKLEYEVLPNLPKSATPSVPTSTPTYSVTVPNITKIDKNSGIKVPSGTKFKAKSNQTISDWSSKGANVSFTTSETVFKKLASIPAGTKIYGKIADSHQPQITGNGGLVEIEITSISYNGKTYQAEGKITKANSKKIFFNNIKGKRQYWKNVGNHINKGENFYKKSRNVANKMSSNPITALLAPIPTAVGMVGCTVCTTLSPITAIGAKGKNISIPAGSTFEIKLTDPAYVQ
jgi:hypothetical protein